MKLLFDQNLSFKLCQRLADIFPESNQVGLVGMANAQDRGVWEYAKAHDFTLVSQDADFADLATLYGPPPKVIWLRCGNQPTGAIERRLRDSCGGNSGLRRRRSRSLLGNLLNRRKPPMKTSEKAARKGRLLFLNFITEGLLADHHCAIKLYVTSPVTLTGAPSR